LQSRSPFPLHPAFYPEQRQHQQQQQQQQQQQHQRQQQQQQPFSLHPAFYRPETEHAQRRGERVNTASNEHFTKKGEKLGPANSSWQHEDIPQPFDTLDVTFGSIAGHRPPPRHFVEPGDVNRQGANHSPASIPDGLDPDWYGQGGHRSGRVTSPRQRTSISIPNKTKTLFSAPEPPQVGHH
jgi:hypothetical protein